MTKGKLIVAHGKEMDSLAGGGGYGWNEAWGQEVIYSEIISRTKPGDKVVDLGGGSGRVSIPLAARGAKVKVVDVNEESMTEGRKRRKKAGLNRNVRNMLANVNNLRKKDIGGGADVVLASDLVVHMSKQEADRVIDNLPKLLNSKRGGLVYVNAPTTENILFEYPEYQGGRRVDERTIELPCDCSGELKDEYMPFYDPGEITARLARQGGNIMRTNTLVRNGDSILEEVVARFMPRRKK